MNSIDTVADVLDHDFNSTSARNYRKWRHIKDVATRYLMALGGVSVILAIVLIAFYLLYVVIPMFKSAEIEQIATYSTPGGSETETLYVAMEEQREVGVRINNLGQVVFFNTVDGVIRSTVDLGLADDVSITAVSSGDQTERMIGLGLSDGRVMFFQHNYAVSFPDDVRLITPSILYPFGSEPIQVNEVGDNVTHLSVQYDSEEATIVAHGADSTVKLLNLIKEESMLSDEIEITREESLITLDTDDVIALRIDIEQREMYVADGLGNIYYYDISNKSEPRLVQKVKAVDDGIKITVIEFLAGGISILVGGH